MGGIKEFVRGIKNGIPICMGYIAVSFAFGIQASETGLTVFQAALMSLMNVTSAGQFSSLELIMNNATMAEMALLQFVINMRYLLMSCALTQKFPPKMKGIHRFFIATGVTDEIFAVSVTQKGYLYPAFSYGLISISVFGWVSGTVLGAAAGQIMPQRLISCLGLAIYGMFISIIIPECKENRAVRMAVVVSMLLSTLFVITPVLKEISSGFRIIIITVVMSAVAACLFPVEDKEAENNA